MKKHMKDFLYFVLIYFILVVLGNVRKIISVLINHISFSEIKPFSIIIVFSTILSFIIIYLFKNGKIKNKKILYSTLINILCINVISGAFTSFEITPYVLLYVFLMLSCFSFMLKYNKSFEISLCISTSIIILFSFIIGMLGLLNILKYLLAIIFILLIIYNYLMYKKDTNKYINSVNNLFCTVNIIFTLVFYISIIGNIGMYVNSWDEYSFWAYDAKALISSSKFSVSNLNVERASAYPPLLSVWHYIISIFTGSFAEQNLYIGLNILIYIYLLPAFYWLKNRNLVTMIFGGISILYGCTLFGGVYTYISLYADLVITASFLSAIMICEITNLKTKFDKIAFFIMCMVICLMKPNGIVSVAVLILITSLRLYFKEYKNNKNIIVDYFKYVFKKWWKLILFVLAVFVIWNIYYRITSSSKIDFYDFQLLPNSLKSDLQYKLNSNFILNFLMKVIASFDSNEITLFTSLSLYQYLLLMFAGLGIILYFDNEKDLSATFKQLFSYFIGYILFFALTVLSLFVLFSYYEAENLASFGRYLNWFHLAYFIYIIAALSKKNITLNKKGNIAVTCVYFIIALCVTFTNTFYFVTNYQLRQNTEANYYAKMDKFSVINSYTSEDSKIYVIDQTDKDGIMAMWYARYYTFPREVNASAVAINWKIKTYKNVDDLQDWGFTAEAWADHLIEYDFDYLFLYTVDDEFFDEIDFMLDDKENSKKYILFEIDKDNKKLIPIA